METRKSNPNKPLRIMVYGVEGVGKSTLGAKSDKPVFISPEGGTDQLTDINGNPVDEMVGVHTWPQLENSIHQLLIDKHDFRTLVIDSADWIEGLCHAEIIGKSGKSIITCNGGYGTGYRQAQTMHKELIDRLAHLREKRGMNIIVTAHAHVRPVKDPATTEDYDAFEIKCHEFVSSLWREWVDGLFFIRFRTFVKTGDDSNKARAFGDGSRLLYTVKQPAFQAKNRYGMPSEINFTPQFWSELLKYARKEPEKLSSELLIEAIGLIDLLPKDAQDLPHQAVEKAKSNAALVKIIERLKELTNKKGEENA